MPGKNGKGPSGSSGNSSVRIGRGQGKGQGQGQGKGRGGCGGVNSESAMGECLCPQCGAVTPHAAGAPCNGTKCPECGASMIRK